MADTNVTSSGRISSSITCVPAEKLLLLTKMVYVKGSPATAGSGESLLKMVRFTGSESSNKKALLIRSP
jgi:hypothetical protein